MRSTAGQRIALGAGALLMACNAILGIDDDYHKVGKGSGGSGGASGAGASSGASSSGTSGKSGKGGTTNGNVGGKGGSAGTSSSGTSASGEAGILDQAGTDGGGRGGSGASGGTGARGGSSSGKGGTGGGSGEGGEINLPAPENALVTTTFDLPWQIQNWTETTDPADLTVLDDVEAQTWEGFGMAFTEAGWKNLSQLTPADRNEALYLLFSADAAHFAWGQIPIGANNYATDRYTDDEVTTTDPSLAAFSIERDQMALIPWIKAAQDINPRLRFWAAPWTPPTWMKDNHNFDGGNMKSDAATLQAFADYLVKFVEAYAEEGITIEKVAPQSEPGYALQYPSCLWSAATYTAFVRDYLGPALAGQGVDIMLGKLSNSDPGKDDQILASVMSDSAAKPFIKLVGVQWSMLDQMSTVTSFGLPVWQTEHQAGNYPWLTGYQSLAPNDHAYAIETWGLIRDWIKAGATQYSAWHAMLDKVGTGLDLRAWAQNSLLYFDPNSSSLKKTGAFYVFRHLSQFVDPGAKVVATTGGTDNCLAFKNPDGSLVLVVYNEFDAASHVVGIGGKNLRFDMPGDGWATVKFVP